MRLTNVEALLWIYSNTTVHKQTET